MDTQPTNNGPLFKRIAAVMAAVRNMPKDGVNTQSNFNYFSSDGILDRIGKEMAAHGLVIIPTLTEYDSVDEPTNSGKTRTRTRAYFQMDICDVDGNAYSARWAGEGTDYGNPDRALNKAMTNATKYFLLKLFVVGQGGDADDDEAGEAPARRATTPRQPQPAKPQQPPAQKTAESGLVSGWQNPDAAMDWAVSVGASENIHAAREAFKRMVGERFDGKLTTGNIGAAYAAWYDDRMAKLNQSADAVEDKFNAPSPEERGAKPVQPTAGKRMAARMQPA